MHKQIKMWAILILLVHWPLVAQTLPAEQDSYNQPAIENPDFVDRENEDHAASDQSNYFFGDPANDQPMLDEPELLAQNNTTNTSGGSSNLSGFAESRWQTGFNAVRTRLASLATSDTSTEKVEIVALEANKYILVKRNDILYRYNFYRTPYEVALLENHDLKKEEHDQKEALLYHVKIIIPFIAAQQVKDKLVRQHGPNTRTTVDQKRMDGANIWELGNGLIFQWYEPYKQKPYTRTIDFISTEMAQKIMAEYKNYFSAPERLLLQKLLVN